MRALTGLLFGSLLLAFAFPALIIFFGFIALVLIATIAFALLRGHTFKVYTTHDGYGNTAQRREAPPDDPEIIDTTEHSAYDDDDYTDESGTQSAPDDEDTGEIVELPATALHKDDEDNK